MSDLHHNEAIKCVSSFVQSGIFHSSHFFIWVVYNTFPILLSLCRLQTYVQYRRAQSWGTGHQRYVYAGVTGLSLQTWWDRWKSPQTTANLWKPKYYNGGLLEKDQPVSACMAGPARSLSNTELFRNNTSLQLLFSRLLAKRPGGQSRKEVVFQGHSGSSRGQAGTQHSGGALASGQAGSGWLKRWKRLQEEVHAKM